MSKTDKEQREFVLGFTTMDYHHTETEAALSLIPLVLADLEDAETTVERLRGALEMPTGEAEWIRAAIGHVAGGKCECDPSVGAVPCITCAMQMVKKWSEGMIKALAPDQEAVIDAKDA